MHNRKPTIAIVGGGLGGLTCALALARIGYASVVIEQYPETGDVGAGIQLSPNATRCLNSLGLFDKLSAIAEQPEAMLWRDGADDRELAELELGSYIANRFSAPFLQFNRAELANNLEAACLADDLIQVRKNELVERIEFTQGKTLVHTSQETINVDLCVGADGSHSTVRQYHHGTPSKRQSAGVAFRTKLPLSVLDVQMDAQATYLWLHQRFHVVVYPVGTPRMLNCVFVVDAPVLEQSADPHRQSAKVSDLKRGLARCSPILLKLVEEIPTGDLFCWHLYQFPPEPRDTAIENPVVLIGDAWHTTFPFAGQGAALAIEDAVVLANCLQNVTPDSYQRSLTRFEKLRIPRIRAVQAISKRNRRIYHLKNPAAKSLRNLAASYGFRKTSGSLFAYDATSIM